MSSAAQSVQTITMLLAPGIGAFMAKALGVGNVFAICGVLCIFAGISYLIFLKINRLEVIQNKQSV
ncbi:hypothetical protein H1Z61_08745 [Bacillus aquiflavi]|uniref:MFS transporter n=1 Tax=Bacillus aquiflavi TaxID=2672567 RepID=A0A7W2AF70_9BACI|nr:hypothetical protein [Bacillus aquiflavi]MBA4537228.1 hypothetical protein [Bacillus aquiflavi]UAC49507.1 hypothetical protein K6959_06640 [Bacillus aquiflavi]